MVKIDRQWLSDPVVLPHLIAICEELNVDIVAEGIETRSQAELLRSLGCELAQGFLFSRPIEADQITNVALANHC